MHLCPFDSEGHIRELADMKLEVVRTAIASCKGNSAEAARQLGIGRSTLYRLLGRSSQEE